MPLPLRGNYRCWPFESGISVAVPNLVWVEYRISRCLGRMQLRKLNYCIWKDLKTVYYIFTLFVCYLFQNATFIIFILLHCSWWYVPCRARKMFSRERGSRKISGLFMLLSFHVQLPAHIIYERKLLVTFFKGCRKTFAKACISRSTFYRLERAGKVLR